MMFLFKSVKHKEVNTPHPTFGSLDLRDRRVGPMRVDGFKKLIYPT